MLAGRKCIAEMSNKKEEMESELSNLREIITNLSEKMDTWRLRHEILAAQRDRAEATVQHLWVQVLKAHSELQATSVLPVSSRSQAGFGDRDMSAASHKTSSGAGAASHPPAPEHAGRLGTAATPCAQSPSADTRQDSAGRATHHASASPALSSMRQRLASFLKTPSSLLSSLSEGPWSRASAASSGTSRSHSTSPAEATAASEQVNPAFVGAQRPAQGSQKLDVLGELEPNDIFQDSLPPSEPAAPTQRSLPPKTCSQANEALAYTPLRPLTLSQKKRRRTATPRWNVDDSISLIGADENEHPNLASAGRGDVGIKGGWARQGFEGKQQQVREANILTPLRLR